LKGVAWLNCMNIFKWKETLYKVYTKILFPCFRRQFLRKMWPVQLAFLRFILCRMFLSSLTLCITFSIFTQSVQTIFSILLQDKISKFWRYFWSTFGLWDVKIWTEFNRLRIWSTDKFVKALLLYYTQTLVIEALKY
jgi:hypothetical protein